jgi:hypothetical protein
MSGKTGSRETGRKPNSTRRHDSLAAGTFGRENTANIKSEQELNRKISGQPSQKHSDYKREAGKTKKK